MVYVISKTGKPLMPTERHGKVKLLLESGKAKVVKRTPFTIQLLYETREYVQPVTLGVTDNTAIIIPQATVDNTELQAGDVWFDATSGKQAGPLPDDGSWVAIASGADILMTVATSSMTSGNVTVYVEWKPLSTGATVVAA